MLTQWKIAAQLAVVGDNIGKLKDVRGPYTGRIRWDVDLHRLRTAATSMTSKRRSPRTPASGTARVLGGAHAEVVWPTLATLPFLETLLFNLHINAGRRTLPVDEYIRVGLWSVILWVFMCFAFLAEEKHLTSLVEYAKRNLHELWHSKAGASSAILFLSAIVVAYGLFGRVEALKLIKDFVLDPPFWWACALLAVVYVALRLLAALLQSLGDASPGLQQAAYAWSLSMRLSVGFYVALLLVTWHMGGFRKLSDFGALSLNLSLGKDYLLLFLIANLLYAGLFKFRRATVLRRAFQTIQGLTQFMIACAIIAVFAVWADFRGLGRTYTQQIYVEPWQKDYLLVHVFFRDIALLLLPIGFLFFSTVVHFAHEHNPTDRTRGPEVGR